MPPFSLSAREPSSMAVQEERTDSVKSSLIKPLQSADDPIPNLSLHLLPFIEQTSSLKFLE